MKSVYGGTALSSEPNIPTCSAVVALYAFVIVPQVARALSVASPPAATKIRRVVTLAVQVTEPEQEVASLLT